ncbi:branched-chain amino acid transport system substrate-binding protein [Azospirillum agricola]|uniref:ABC transporter substrate-binding protein n=1 Tax=Azospirillum agricola TaxID=1720247 RepID=UPI001AEA5599|nr:ABC transporter substrate-binding protein [Azospirillum agricola]MBP2229392.1 branched-chain amino acid transport system substrate-binding protein [Azospirillum agricola]
MRLSSLLLSTALCLGATAALAQAPQDVFRIGVLGDHSGPYADFSGPGAVVAAKLAVEDFGGTVLGKRIEILSADHQNKADTASNKARQWIDVDGVHAIADMTNSAAALSVQALTKERGIVALASGPATTRLTNEDCSPTGFHWVMDTYSQSIGSARAVVQEGGKNWFLVTADYAFGHQMAADLRKEITANGGKIVGEVRHPTNANDFSSYLLQAQSSGAQIVGLANGGSDTINSVKQAAEFGITDAGQKLVGLVLMISDVHAMGLSNAKGLIATTAYYWDRDDGSRAFAKRYEQTMKRMPTQVHAGIYSSVLHYLKAVQAAGTDKGTVVAEKMRELPVNDFFAHDAKIRADGRVVHDMYLVEVKRPEDSKGPWDYYKVLRTIPAEQAVIPLSESKCYMVKG